MDYFLFCYLLFSKVTIFNLAHDSYSSFQYRSALRPLAGYLTNVHYVISFAIPEVLVNAHHHIVIKPEIRQSIIVGNLNLLREV
jgi:hypothetical protein